MITRSSVRISLARRRGIACVILSGSARRRGGDVLRSRDIHRYLIDMLLTNLRLTGHA